MTRSRGEGPLIFDPEIEKTCRRLRAVVQKEISPEVSIPMDEQRVIQQRERTMMEYATPSLNGTTSSITRPTVSANNFEIKPAIIQMIQQTVQFCGFPNEDPNAHIANFLEICDTFKHNGVSDDAIRLRLFPFSLKEKAKGWLNSLPAGSITTWEEMAHNFLAKYFPPSKTAKMRNDITTFSQFEAESLYEAWERFKDLLRRVPHHGLPVWLQVQTFYNGLTNNNKTMIDAAAGGSLNSKTPEAAYNLIEEMATNSYQWQSDRSQPRKAAGIHSLDSVTSLSAQIEALNKKIDKMSMTAPAMQVQGVQCDQYGGGQRNIDCQEGSSFSQPNEQVDYVGNFPRQQNNPYSSTYNPGWRNHPNFSWGNQNTQKPYAPPGFAQNDKKPNMEEVLTKFMQSADTRFQNTKASIKNLETQIGQLAKMLSDRTQGTLPSNTETNPREHVKAIALRSGKELEEVQPKKLAENDEAIQEKQEEKKIESEKEREQPKREEIKHNIPYPGRLKQQQLDKQFGKFLNIFKQLHINIPFVDALSQMPNYAKFLKEILSSKRKLEDVAMVRLNEECSAILQNKMPQKLKDPGNFTIPCNIGDLSIKKALCDLGASINLMPYSIYEKLGLGDPKPTRITLQLADRSVKHPIGIIEDVLVKVDKFIFPVDFVILDMEEDFDVPIILGRPFLATARALIDVHQGKLTLRIYNEEITFTMSEAIKFANTSDDICYMIDTLDPVVQGVFQENQPMDALEQSLTHGGSCDMEKEAIREQVAYLDARLHLTKGKNSDFEDIPRSQDKKDKLSVEEPPKLELKPLPPHLQYAFLEENSRLQVIISSTLSDLEKEKLLRVLREHKRAIAWKIADIKGISPSFCTHKILMEDDYKPCVQPQRRLNPKMKDVVKAEVIKLLDAGIIYPISDSSWVSPVQVVPKKGGMTVVPNEKNELVPMRTVTGWRVCIDYRKLNDATRKDHFPLPFIDQMLERLSGHAYYCFLDGYSGYFQIPIAPEDQEKTTFTCPYGTFAYRRMPFGLCNAPATFQRCMIAIFADMVEKYMEVFMDDFSVFGSSFDSCLNNLEKVFTRCEETNLVLNWEKCHFMVKEGIVLGHKVSNKGIEVDKAKIEAIEKLPPLISIKIVRSFLGHAGFYRRFIKDFSKIARPLTNLLQKDVPFQFSEECLEAFNILKNKLINAPIMVAPDWDLPFEIMCDASDYAVGAVLGQRRNKHFQPIYYASKTLTVTQQNYTTTEKELLAVVYAFDKFISYLLLSKVTIFNDHSTFATPFGQTRCKTEID